MLQKIVTKFLVSSASIMPASAQNFMVSQQVAMAIP